MTKETDVIEISAWELLGEYYDYWANGDYSIMMPNGRARYEDAYNTRTDSVCIARLEPVAHMKVKVVKRYLRHDAVVFLIKDKNIRKNLKNEQ